MKKRIAVFLTVLLLILPGVIFAKYTPTGVPVLMMDGYGARIMSMSGVFVSIADDINTLTLNPAGLGIMMEKEISIMYMRYPFGMNFGYAAFGIPLSKKKNIGTIGIGVTTSIMQKFDEWDDMGNLTGRQLGGNDIVVYAGYGLNLLGNRTEKHDLSLGLTVKYIYSKMIDDSSSGIAFDIGIVYKARVYTLNKQKADDGFSLGVAYNNLGTKVRIGSGDTRLPTDLKIGTSYKLLKSRFSDWVLGVDFGIPNDSNISLDIGTEYVIKRIVALRIGFNILGKENDLFSCGLGGMFKISKVKLLIDYAFKPMTDFGFINVFSIGLKF